MNRATHNLENDHAYILQLTEVMEKMAERIKRLTETYC